MITYKPNEVELIEKAYKPLYENLKAKKIVAGTVELINAHLTFDPKEPFIDLGSIKKAPRKYQKHELDWYLSEDLSIRGHEGIEDNPIWSNVCTKDGLINSNYGWCVFSKENGDGNNSQYDFALKQLLLHPDGRQSVIFYNRPSMQWVWDDGIHACHDFTCTFQTQHFIRENKLEYVLTMRSNDALLGLINDFRWAAYVYERLMLDLQPSMPTLQYGSIHWNAGSLHMYERNWDVLTKVVEEYDAYIKS